MNVLCTVPEPQCATTRQNLLQVQRLTFVHTNRVHFEILR